MVLTLKNYNPDSIETYGKKMFIFFFVGDYLTFERSQQAINSQSDRTTPADRMEGLVVVMADFHVQLNFMKLIYKTLFQVRPTWYLAVM